MGYAPPDTARSWDVSPGAQRDPPGQMDPQRGPPSVDLDTRHCISGTSVYTSASNTQLMLSSLKILAKDNIDPSIRLVGYL